MADGTLLEAADEIVAAMAEITGIRKVHGDPPEDPGQGLVAAVYSTAGRSHKESAGFSHEFDDITIALMIPRDDKDLARAVRYILPFRDEVTNKLHKKLEDGGFTKFQTWNGDITATLGPIQWGSVAEWGYLFTVPSVKRRRNVT